MEEFSEQPLEHIMDAPEDNFGADDTVSVPGKSHPQQKRGRDDKSEVGVGEKRWPGWPGENVFRILVPAQKVGGIIGRKGEFIKKMCEETRARIKILDGPPGTQERAVLSANLRKHINHQSDFKIRRTKDPDCWDQH